MNRRELVGRFLVGVAGFYSIKTTSDLGYNMGNKILLDEKAKEGNIRASGQVTLTPEMFLLSKERAYFANGKEDFFSAFSLMFSKANELSDNKIVNIKIERDYHLSRASFEIPSNCHIFGNGLVFLDSNADNEFVFCAVGKSDFSIKDVQLSSSKVNNLWSKSAHGILIDKCIRFTLSNLNISFRTDAVAISSSHSFLVSGCTLHDLGEEGIVVRASSRWLLFDNHIYHHNGDGILLKTGNQDSRDGKIVFNRIHNGSDRYGLEGTNGGGITLNDEVKGSSTSFHNLLVLGNTIENTSYGIAFTNIKNLKVVSNNVTSVKRFGIVIDNSIYNNPRKNSSSQTLISGNSVQYTQQAGISFSTLNGINVENTIISSNFVTDCGLQSNGDFSGISANNATMVDNRVSRCRTLLSAKDCTINSNVFLNSLKLSSGSHSAALKIGGQVIFTSNVVVDDNMGHIRLGDVSGSIFSNNKITTNSDFAVFHSENNLCGLVVFKNNVVISKANVIFKFNTSSMNYISTDLDTLGHKTTYSGLPTDGVYKKGDKAFDVDADFGMPCEWLCVKSGNPGQWQVERFINLILKSDRCNITLQPQSFDDIYFSDERIKNDYSIVSVMSSSGILGAFFTAIVKKDGEAVVRLTNTENNVLVISTVVTLVLNAGY